MEVCKVVRKSGQLWVSLGLGIVALLLTACLPWQWDYLNEATGRVTQKDVKERFGAPLRTKALENEGSLWVYRYEVRSSLVGMRGDMVGGAPCIEYLLTFDGKNVLTYWTRQPCGLAHKG
ncbi:MAG: hypothetical protein EPO64_08760 [Nitrospirae bacterium]|nr:MAG: hypothetical protein EPO64_08760 [Nitrospirota bacterium]